MSLSRLRKLKLEMEQRLIEFDEDAAGCLVLAWLRLMDLDIGASGKSVRGRLLSIRDEYVATVGRAVSPESQLHSSGLANPLGMELRRSCTSTAPHHAAMILSEVAVANPWPNDKVNRDVRRIVLKELATYFNVREPELRIDHVIDHELPKRITVKRIVLITLFSVAGGLVAAPHIGAAIGAGMGLSGAAATAAGLATLGFGSVAAGGFGMAGGTLIVGFVTGAIGGASSLATAASRVKSNPELEALKLRISLGLMRHIRGAESVGVELTASIEHRIDALIDEVAALRVRLSKLEKKVRTEKAKDVRNEIQITRLKSKVRELKKKRIPEVEDEIKLLRSSLPDVD